MRRFLFVTITLLSALTMSAKIDGVLVKGQIIGHTEGGVQVMGSIFSDTLQCDAKGNFVFRRVIKRPEVVMLISEEHRAPFYLYLENGMKASMKIKFNKGEFEGMPMYTAEVVEYKGDLKDCFEFQNDFVQWEHDGWSFERIAQYDFLTYRKMLDDDVNNFRSRLNTIKSESFKNIFSPRLEERAKENVMRFAWAKNTVDPEFEKFMNATDRNDPANTAFAFSYQRWYFGTHPMEKGYTPSTWYMETLKRNFSNQDIINQLATNYMGNYLRRAPSDIDEGWEAYKKTVTDEKAISKLQAIYDKFAPGKVAPDFDMTGFSDDKLYTLKDFRGKALYVDCWATWCGPCCYETPFYAKLIEEFKDDDRIEFISISFDNSREKLEKMLEEEKPQWRQFWCKDAFSSKLAKGYNISGIPRFIFIDKDGKLISSSAPRPSQAGTKEYVLHHLR